MNDLRTSARTAILDRCLWASPDQVGGPTMCSGWPGLMLVQRCIERRSGTKLTELTEVASRWRALDVPLPALPVEVCDTFLYGARGQQWAEHLLVGCPHDDTAPPERALGFDTFANDGPIYFDRGHQDDAEHREAWSRFITRELCHFEHGREEGRALPLGFAHGVAGLLFRALLLGESSPIDPARIRHGLDWLASQRVEDDGCARWPARRGHEVLDSWVTSSLCNGSLGHALVYLEAAARLGDDEYLAIAQRALAASADESRVNLGFCCGHAGRAMVVSRFLRLGLRPSSTEAEGTLARLWARVPARVADDGLRPLSGLPSCLPALCAEDPASPVLDLFLPPPPRS